MTNTVGLANTRRADALKAARVPSCIAQTPPSFPRSCFSRERGGFP
jgi:hypothetical protein